MDKWTVLILINFIIPSIINGQNLILYGCPDKWVIFGNECYKFEINSPKVYEEATVDCWMTGAKLLSINNDQEHLFVSNYLTKIHAARASAWLTGGLYGHKVVTWEGATSPYSGTTFWNREPRDDEVFSRVAYQGGNKLHGGYGWALVSASVPYNYICKIPQRDATQILAYNRDIGYGVGVVDMNQMIKGPTMVSEPVGVVVVGSRGNTIYLECDARSNPMPVYRWYRGKYANESLTAASNSRYTLSGGRLTIQNPKVGEDEDFYRCTVENDQGKIMSKVAQIMFGYLHEFSPVRPDDAWGTMSEGVKIACQAPGYNPAVRYSWYKFKSNNWVYPGHPYHFNSQAGYLYFSEVQWTDGRQYFCIVTLTARQGMVKSTEQPLARTSYGRYLVIKPENAGGYGPIIHTHTFPSPALKGYEIRMECIAYGSLPLSYSWYREDGRPLPKGTKITNRNRVLTIPNAQLDAEGNYVCKCKRPGATATKIIALQMEAIPYFPINIQDVLADTDQTVTWRCKAVARPQPNYSWFKDGKLITSIAGKIEQVGSNLIIYKIEAKVDAGMYQCAATNQHGTTYSTGQLKVIAFKPNFHRYPLQSQTLGPIGGNITIPCKAEGAPLPQITWLRNGVPLNLQPGMLNDRIGMTYSNSLVIHGLQNSDWGRYICKATNSHGEATTTTSLKIVNEVVITQAPLPTTVQVNHTALLSCQASYSTGNQDIAYTWKFNGHPLNMKQNNYHFVQDDESRGMHSLYIRNVQYTDQGQYECEAKTPLHTDSKSTYLSVLGPPGIPAGLYIDHMSITTYSARVIWTVGPETDRGDPIFGYDIEAETQYHPGNWNLAAPDIQEPVAIATAKDFRLREDQRAYVVKTLTPNNSYRFRVRAINSLGRGIEASTPSTVVKIPPSAPIKAPINISGGSGKVGTLVITWTPLDIVDQCGDGIGYRVYWKLHGDHKSNWLKAVIHGNQGKHVALVGTENYYLLYDVMVGSFNSLGDGPNSTITDVYSAEGLPVAVPTITGLNSLNQSSMQVTWDPVPDNRLNMKGRIAGYTTRLPGRVTLNSATKQSQLNGLPDKVTIKMTTRESVNVVSSLSVQYYWNYAGVRPVQGYTPVKFRWRNTHGNATSVVLIDLEVNSEFYFRMQVFNTAGWGPKGEWRRSETPGCAPLTYPQFVTVSPHTDQSVRVHWRQLKTMNYANEESLSGYMVKWWKVSDDVRSAQKKYVGWVQETIVQGLQKQTVYVLRVAGWSGGGDGLGSDPVYFTVLGGVISLDPATSQICFSDHPCNKASLNSYSSILNFACLIIVLFSFFRRAFHKK